MYELKVIEDNQKPFSKFYNTATLVCEGFVKAYSYYTEKGKIVTLEIINVRGQLIYKNSTSSL